MHRILKDYGGYKAVQLLDEAKTAVKAGGGGVD